MSASPVASVDVPRRSARLARRMPLLALALVALLAGLWAGLLRLGFAIPELRPALAADHGPLLVLGFLGTQIGLERAVALRHAWTWIAPSCAGAGALWLIIGLPATGGRILLAIAGAVLVAVFCVVHVMQPTWHNVVMALGAVGWLGGALIWTFNAQMTTVVPWLVAFLVLTIVGERLELSRVRRPPRHAMCLLLAAVGIFCVGIATSLTDVGVRLAGIGLVGQALWLARYDVARRTIRMRGATRFMAAALIPGYAWLFVAGVLWIGQGKLLGGGYAYDAMLHAIFLGFVFSMVFAHAQVIVPAVLGVRLPHNWTFYIPLVLLHAGLIVRVAGDATASMAAWRTGGVIDETAVIVFLIVAVATGLRESRKRRRPVAARARM